MVFGLKDFVLGSVCFSFICILSCLMGQKKIVLKYIVFYVVIAAIQQLCIYLPQAIETILSIFTLFIRVMIPVVLFASTFIATTKVSELIAAMYSLKIPRSITITFAMVLRFFPTFSEEIHNIYDAMKLRGIALSWKNVFTRPMLILEAITIPIVMRSASIAEELSASAVTRGIDNPAQRTSFIQLKVHAKDWMVLAVGVFMSSASMILQAGIGITIFVGAILLASGQIELLPLLMFLLMVTRIYGPILAILANLSSLLNLNVVTSRMRTLLTTPAMDGDGKTVPNCDIELSHVTFAYNQEDVIKDVSCKIPQGSVTALVGPSGSGKSTISKLIARFWDVQKGKITVGGKDIKSMEPESLMSYMSFVFQDVTLFNDTVMNNIRLGNPNATDDQVIAAAKAAYCDEFVREMPDGYQTVLGENGSTLSGGERQRISIARALLKNAPIILLDEATASLDPENEVLVQKAIAKLVEGKTVIMIAHRLRTVVDADQILVLDNGRLVEHGTHDELMKKNGLYHKLFHIQQESLGWAV